MLPCYQTCPRHGERCHKTCPQWAEFQARQALQRQRRKDYLKYYGELCELRTRQFRILSPTRW